MEQALEPLLGGLAVLVSGRCNCRLDEAVGRRIAIVLELFEARSQPAMAPWPRTVFICGLLDFICL